MKELKKVLKISSLVLIMILSLCSCVPKIKNGFIKENNTIHYYLNDEMQTGWIKDNSDYYYFDNDGIMKTSWLEENGYWYYLDNDGKMYKDKMLHEKGKIYYFDTNGQMLTNSKKLIDDLEYTFDFNGEGTVITGNMYLTNCRMTNIMGVPVEKSSFMPLGTNNGENFCIDMTYSTIYQSSTCNINVGIFDDNTFLNIKNYIFPLDFFTNEGIKYTITSNSDSQLPNVISQIREGKINYIMIYNKYKYKFLDTPEEKTEAFEQYENKHK